MKVLVVGNGAREHALCWKVRKNSQVKKIFVAPGNGGIANIAECVDILPTQIESLVNFAQKNKVDLTIIGPEAPLAAGVADAFEKRKLPIFAPLTRCAQIETSKSWAKDLMREARVPTAPYCVFRDAIEAYRFCAGQTFPIVIKADGLAAGKGVFIVQNLKEAGQVIDRILVQRIFGNAGNCILVEQFLTGVETSVICLCDGSTALPLMPAMDYKRAYDGGKGPNTGGMGAIAPSPLLGPKYIQEILETVFTPVLETFQLRGIPFIGFLYAGLIFTPNGMKVLEFNARLGDPETQVILPLLDGDLVDLLFKARQGKLAGLTLKWKPLHSMTVVVAAEGYPGKVQNGRAITGLDQIKTQGVYPFHGGTERRSQKLVNSGGRVIALTALGDTLQLARQKIYNEIGKVRFDGAWYRKDIGADLPETLPEPVDEKPMFLVETPPPPAEEPLA